MIEIPMQKIKIQLFTLMSNSKMGSIFPTSTQGTLQKLIVLVFGSTPGVLWFSAFFKPCKMNFNGFSW